MIKSLIGACLVAASLGGFTIAGQKITKTETKTELKPFAHYDFEDQANPGKDTSGHGFNLIKKGTDSCYTWAQDGNDGYISMTRQEYTQADVDALKDQHPDWDDATIAAAMKVGQSKGIGCYMYAPALVDGGSKDFSDLITGSYTVSFKIKTNHGVTGINQYQGDRYALTTGRYTDSFTVVPWQNGLQVQFNCRSHVVLPPESQYVNEHMYCEGNTFIDGNLQDIDQNWYTITCVGDQDSGSCYYYVNGSYVGNYEPNGGVYFSNQDMQYTFCINAQCEVNGGAQTQFGSSAFKDIVIYDCALSSDNVENLYNGNLVSFEDQGDNVTKVTSIAEVDFSKYDLIVTDKNTVADICNNVLPQTVKATLSNGVERSYPCKWYPAENNKIYGIVQTGKVNPDQLKLETTYSYGCLIDYDNTLVDVTNIKLDGVDYVPGTAIDAQSHQLSFNVVPKNSSVIVEEVQYLDFGWDAEPDDPTLYYIDIIKGAQIVVVASLKEYKVTYYDGDTKLGTSKYTLNGSEALRTFEKEGYTFEGWYTDAALTQKFTALDYANPVDITLYAKWTSNSQGGGTTGSGCGGVVSASIIALCGSFVALGLLAAKKKEEK